MARLPLVNPDDPGIDPAAAAMLQRFAEVQPIGPANVQRALANHGELLSTLWAFADVVYFRNSLNPIQGELAYYTSAVTNDCHY